jgi:hypothetical protein
MEGKGRKGNSKEKILSVRETVDRGKHVKGS